MSVSLKPIVPQKQFKAADLTNEINKAVNTTLKTGVGFFKRTTKTWNHDVTFVVDPAVNGTGSVGTDDDIYGYVTRGTRPHLITPKNGGYLVFGEGNYVAKTNPGILGSRLARTGLQGTGGVARPIFAKVVHHPGTKARGFEELVAAKLQLVLENNVTAAILKVVG